MEEGDVLSKNPIHVLPVLCFAFSASCATPAPDAPSFAPGEQQIVHHVVDMQYGPGPASVPFPCEMAVREGSPKATGLFTIRMRTQEPWVMPPHSHPRAERVTVLSGTIHVGFGTSLDKSSGETFLEGDYYVNAPGAVHYVWADGPVEIQITGMGPWEIHPLE
jgi:hypothetical protein